ncbi:MAG TPA: hypothetical protein VN903_28660 [Polyangia bacterium]|nr:hypothetical protein [Polyangia bacterium]
MTATTPKHAPGTLALETLKALAVKVHGPAGSPEASAALGEIHSMAADLRALLARNAELVAALAQTVDVLARAHSTIDGLKQPALDCARAALAAAEGKEAGK